MSFAVGVAFAIVIFFITLPVAFCFGLLHVCDRLGWRFGWLRALFICYVSGLGGLEGFCLLAMLNGDEDLSHANVALMAIFVAIAVCLPATGLRARRLRRKNAAPELQDVFS